MSIIRDPSLAPLGLQKIDWVKRYMPLLAELETEFAASLPLKGKKIALSIHLEAKTARLCLLLKAAGAEVHATGSNPLSTQDEIAAALDSKGIDVSAFHGASAEEYESHCKAALMCEPDILIDDGGDLLCLLHGELKDKAANVIGGCEETTTGVHRMRARAKNKALRFPMIAVNDASTKHLFDNRFGTGQSVFDAIMRRTNLVVAGKNVVVAGFGHCGLGVAEKARGLGARVIVTEVDPVKALEAALMGFSVMSMDDAAKLGDLFITVTGCNGVITERHFRAMKDGALLTNAGHFDVEVDVKRLREIAVAKHDARECIEGYELPDGRTLMVIGEGRLVNLAAGDGHPSEIMDMSFALQALCAVYLAGLKQPLAPDVYDVPEEIDKRVAYMKVKSLNMTMDTLTDEQVKYLAGE